MSCNCENYITNTGLPSCTGAEELPDKIWLMPIYDKDGARNGLDLSSLPLVDGTLSDLINEPDKSKRLYPINKTIYNYAFAENEDTTDDKDGVPFKVRDGEKTVTWEYAGVPMQMAAIFEDLGCTDFGLYFSYKSGGIKGDLSKDKTILYPIQVNKETFRSSFNHTSSTTSTILINALFDRYVTYKNLKTLSSEAFVEDTSNISGLIDVYGSVVGTVTTSEFTVDVKTNYSSFDRPVVYENGGETDFTLVDDTGTAIVKTVVESAVVPGRYTFTATTASGDISVLGLASSVTGYEMKPLTITTP